jgi:cobalt/nickel transport system ATP-binding protein
MGEKPEDGGPLLRLEDLSFAYPGSDTPILDSLSLTLQSGERLGLIGPNGSGKTTFFHIIVGLLKPQSGTVRFKGKPLTEEKGFTVLRKEVGLLFQDADDQLFSPTVLDDVAFGPLNLGLSVGDARARAEQTLATLGLTGYEQRLTHHLSGGEKKLVALATILAMQPSVLLLDEPTNDLDSATRAHLIGIINTLSLASIIISHDWDFLAATCTTIYGLRGGRVEISDELTPHAHRHAHPHGEHPHRHEDD